MKKIIEFIKEYWYVLGAILIATVVIFYWRDTGIFSNAEAVEVPLPLYESDIDINVSEFGDMVTPSPVFDVDVYDTDDFGLFLELFKIGSSYEPVEDGYKYGTDKQSVVYYPNTGLAYMYFDSPVDIGIVLEEEISDENIDAVVEDLHDMLFENFPEFRLQSSTISDFVNVKIDYKAQSTNSYLSSFYLDGSALEVELTTYGKVRSMSVLMVSKISLFENIPLMSDDQLLSKINLTSFPKSIDYEVTDSEYQNLHPSYLKSTYLSELRVDDVISSWVYFDKDNGYALPMYICIGSGIVEVSTLEDSYDADTIMYVSPIDPRYVILRFEDTGEGDNEEDEVGREEGDLFVGEPL